MNPVYDPNNRWSISDRSCFTTWYADLEDILPRPDRLFEWSISAARLADDCRIAIPVSALGYDLEGRGIGGLVARMRSRYESEGIVDLFHYADYGARNRGASIGTQVAVFDRAGRVVECCGQGPWDLPGWLWRIPDEPDVSSKHLQFLDFCGPLMRHLGSGKYEITYHPLEFVPFEASQDEQENLTVTINTDCTIWMPWVACHDGWMDNRPLAYVHTPRLNRFLSGLRDVTLSLGGNWSYEACRYPEVTHETGIDIDFLYPPEIIRPEAIISARDNEL